MGPASLVRHDDAAFLVDCGSGVGQRLVAAASSGAARGADVLVHEVFLPREMPMTGAGRSEEGIRNVMSYHTLSSEVGRAAVEAAAGTLVLNHFVPAAISR